MTIYSRIKTQETDSEALLEYEQHDVFCTPSSVLQISTLEAGRHTSGPRHKFSMNVKHLIKKLLSI